MSAFVSVRALFEGDQVRQRRDGQGGTSQARVRHWPHTETSRSMSGSTRGARARRTTTWSCALVLPLVAFGEERVTFTSTDRRIQIAEKVIEPPPGPRPAWAQLTSVAQALGAPWKYESSAEIMEEIGHAVPFYSGASHANLARDYGRQWPCTTDKPLGTGYLFEEGIPGRAFRFLPVPKPPPAAAATDGCAVPCACGTRHPDIGAGNGACHHRGEAKRRVL